MRGPRFHMKALAWMSTGSDDRSGTEFTRGCQIEGRLGGRTLRLRQIQLETVGEQLMNEQRQRQLSMVGLHTVRTMFI